MSAYQSATIGIIGSSIAGLSAGLAVAQAGHKVVIFGTLPKHLAGALQLAPNGFAALDKLNALAAMEAHLTRLHAIEIRSARTNSCLATIDHDAPRRRDYAAIARASLANGLYALAKSDRAISFCDEMVTALHCTPDDTSLTTSQGGHHHFDLIIGADGANGLCRKVIDTTDPISNLTRQALRATIDADALPRSFSARRTQLWLGNGYHLVSYPYQDSQTDKMMVNLVLCTPASPSPALQEAHSHLAHRAVLSHLCQDDIIWHKTPLGPAAQLTTWRKYGLILTGDSAHFMPPHLAQGAGQTLEDAATLKAALTDCDTVQQAASQWALQRQRTLRPIIEKAEATGSMMRMTGPLALLRNAAVELGGQRLVEKWLNQVWH